jgi:hypothetical protein
MGDVGPAASATPASGVVIRWNPVIHGVPNLERTITDLLARGWTLSSNHPERVTWLRYPQNPHELPVAVEARSVSAASLEACRMELGVRVTRLPLTSGGEEESSTTDGIPTRCPSSCLTYTPAT